MIKNIKYLLISALLLISPLLSQTKTDYFVVNVKGKITKKSCNQKWQNVSNNDRLHGDDRISIGEKSFINLYDNKSKQYFVIHGVRNFVIKDLNDNKISSEKKPVNDIFVKAFENLANAFSSFADNRGLKEIFRSSQSSQGIVAIMPKNTKVFGDTILFEWIAKDTSSPVQLTLLDENFNKLLDTLIDGKNTYLLEREMEQGKEYIWQLSSQNSGKNVINYFSTADKNELIILNNRLDSLANFFPPDNSPNYYVLKGRLSEDLGYKLAAYRSFKKAYFLANKNEKYGKIIEDFFSRQKMNLTYRDVLSYK